MDNKDKPAMPSDTTVEHPDGNATRSIYMGLSKREHFAAMAMQGFVSQDGDDEATYVAIAQWSVQQADALLAALEGS